MKSMRAIVSTLAVALALIAGAVSATASGTASASATTPAAAKAIRTDTISVPEMQCGMCEERIEEALVAITGVKSATADAEANHVVVKYETKSTSRTKLEAAIAAAGYDAGAKKAVKKAQNALPGCCKPGGH